MKGESGVRCGICPHSCRIKPGERGICKARTNQGGEIKSAAYGKITALALDPIEKKPLDFFYPGSFILSIGSFGCNMRCSFCQNWEISSSGGGGERVISPEELIKTALALKDKGNIGLAYTYNEPLINYEFVSDCAALARKNGLKNVLVSNGMINEAPFQKLLEFIDAANLDLKSFSADFYKEHGGNLDTVKKSIEIAARRIHLEVTTLIIEKVNDSEAEIEGIAAFLSGIKKNIPLHLTPFYPRHKMLEYPPTRRERLAELRRVAGKYLPRVV
jgi:pyruvate formate lyase activating enzyme